MIYDNISHCSIYYKLHPNFKKAFNFILNTNFTTIKPGKYVIDDDNVFATIASVDGNKIEDVKLESHKKYIDLQLLVEGEELIGYKTVSKCFNVAKSYNAKKDVELYGDKPEGFIKLNPFDFMLLYPQDAHAPSISSGKLLKIIIKIKI